MNIGNRQLSKNMAPSSLFFLQLPNCTKLVERIQRGNPPGGHKKTAFEVNIKEGVRKKV
jgi:hypothetical protein